MAAVENGVLGSPGLQEIGGWGWPEDRSLGRAAGSGDITIVIMSVEVSFIAQVVLIFVIIVVLALSAFVIVIQVVVTLSQAFTAALGLHASAQGFKVLALAAPSLEFLLVTSAFLGHLKDVAIGLFVLSIEGVVLLLEALGLLGHFLHLLAEGQEEFIAVVQGVLNLCGVSHGPWGRDFSGGLPYLLKLLNINVQLTTELRFGVREGRDLGTQSTTPSSLVIGSSALLLILGSETLDLGVLTAEEGFVMEFAGIKLLADGLQLRTKARGKSANVQTWRRGG